MKLPKNSNYHTTVPLKYHSYIKSWLTISLSYQGTTHCKDTWYLFRSKLRAAPVSSGVREGSHPVDNVQNWRHTSRKCTCVRAASLRNKQNIKNTPEPIASWRRWKRKFTRRDSFWNRYVNKVDHFEHCFEYVHYNLWTNQWL